MITILKTSVSGSEHSSSFPFFPNQHRISSLHLLVHMISTLFQHSAKQVFEHFRKSFFDIVSIILDALTEIVEQTNT